MVRGNMVSLEGDSEAEDEMDTGPGWLPDPEHEGQERFWNGSDWTDQVRPVGSLNSLHLPDHVPELQRALAGATADIDEVEDRLSTLFDRTGKPGGGRASGGGGRRGVQPSGGGGAARAVQHRPPAPPLVEPERGPDEEFDLTLTTIDEVDEAMDKIVLDLDDADEEPDDFDEDDDEVEDEDVYDRDDEDLDDDDEDEDMDEIVLVLDDADDDVDAAEDDEVDDADDVDDADLEVDGDDDDAFAELDAALASETPVEPDHRLFGRKS